MPRPAWLAVGAASGALALAAAVAPVVTSLGLGLLSLSVAAAGARRRTIAWRLALLAIGVLAIGLRSTLAGPPAPVTQAVPNGEGPWIGVVQSVGAPRAGARPAVIRLETDPPLLVAATLPWFPAVVPSDRVELRGRIRPPPDDEYGEYLARIRAAGTLRAEALDLLPAEGTVAAWLEGLRRGASDGLDRAIPEPEAGLAAGVLIGLRDRVDRALAAAFTTAGASHVVAISGWNIAIVASTLAAVAGGLHRRRRAVLTAIAIVVYVAFVGPSPSVVRAGVMAGVALLARELGRPGTAAAALGWAVTALLLVDPAWVDDAGFRLSVLATAGIIAWGSSLTDRLAGPNPSRPRRWIAEVLGVSFAAQAATTPIVLLEFGRLSLVAPAVNLIVVPLVPPAMAAGAVALIVGVAAGLGLPAVAATLVGLPAWGLYAAMVAVVRIGAGLPLASLELGAPWDVIAAALSLGLILAGARWGGRFLDLARSHRTLPFGVGGPNARAARRPAVAERTRPRGQGHRSRVPRLAALGLVTATIGLVLVVAHRPDGVTRVVVLDVGQGDGILVEGGRGGRMVVDGGPDPGRLLIALDERLPPWDRRIDILVLTHPHEDHVAGLAELLSRYQVGRVYEPGMIGAGPGYRAWSKVFAAAGAPRHGRLATGDRLALDSIRLRVLWPDANRVPERPPDGGTSVNNVSIVLLGEVGPHRFLLAGDVEEGVDPELLARGLPTVDLLKVAHHGSRTASTRPFLEAVRPRVAVVSAGAGNPYGHPAPSTLERLAELARATYRTDTDGTVEVAFDGGAIRVRTTGPRATPRPRAGAPESTPDKALVASITATGSAPNPLLCGLLIGERAAVGDPAPAPAPSAAEAPPPPRAFLGPASRWAAAARTGVSALPRPVDLDDGAARTLGYHPPDGTLPGDGDRAAPRNRSPRLLLGRRRVRPRGGARGVPERRHPLPGRSAGALAPGNRAHRTRPPPGRDPGAHRHGLDVRRGQHRDRPGCGRTDQERRCTGPASRGPRDRGPGQRLRRRRGDRVGRQGPAEQDARRRGAGGGRRGPPPRGTAPGGVRGLDREPRPRAAGQAGSGRGT
jgi:competence protein ComEC